MTFGWVDIDHHPLVPALGAHVPEGLRLPVFVYADGSVSEWPAGDDEAAYTPNGGRGTWWKLEREPLFLESSTPGIFFAGDVRHGSIKRVASAVGEGAMAVQQVHRFLAEPD